MKEFLRECNTSKGRWNRQKFWLYPLGLSLLLLIPQVALLGIAGQLQLTILTVLLGITTVISYAYIIYVSVCSYIKRLRDLDKNPWMTLILFIPFVSIILAIYCGFWKGTAGPNQYGPDPLGGEAKKAASPKIEL